MANLHQKSAFTVSIDLDHSKGSGFQFCYKGNMYIVTARHVLFTNKDAEYHLYGKVATIKAPDFLGGESSPGIFHIELNEANTYYSQNFDVALIHLGKYFLTNSNRDLHPTYRDEVNQASKPTNRGSFWGEYSPCPLSEVCVGNDVYLAGYPTSLGFEDYMDVFDVDRPVLRKGIISHVNYNRKHIVVDCTVFAGNSGGPVFQADVENDGRKTLIGLVSKYIPYRQRYVIPNENIAQINYINSGYALIVSMENVMESIADFAKKLPDPYEGRGKPISTKDIFSDD